MYIPDSINSSIEELCKEVEEIADLLVCIASANDSSSFVLENFYREDHIEH